MALIDLTGVSVRRGDTWLLRDLTLVLAPGVTALLGRNGAGKTTLIRTLAGVQRPTAGTVSTQDGSIFESAAAMRNYRAVLGWVPQGPGFPRGMRADRFVEYAAWLKRLEKTERAGAARRALEACQMGSLATRPLGRLSGGERQRVILAAAIVSRPGVLLLDEPTVGLDPAQRESYLDLLRELGTTATILYSSHLVDDVVRTASRVLVLDSGQISVDLDDTAVAHAGDGLGEVLRRAVIASTDRNG